MVQILLGATHPPEFFSGCIRTQRSQEVGAYDRQAGRDSKLYNLKITMQIHVRNKRTAYISTVVD